MNRWAFLSAGFVTLSLSKRVILRAAQEDDVIDPANQAQTQMLRVLLGSGSAQPIDDSAFLFQGRRYRGTFSNTPRGEVVNTVPLEHYLYSVVSREMPYSWPAAALQVQAIVARTYVLQRSNPRREYDLVPSEADQVYTGIDAEHPQSSAAVDATAGEVLRFGNGFAQALYSSCCGGRTESNADAWGGAPLPYLQGVQCGHCSDSPWYTWKADVQLSRFQQTLASQLQSIGDLTSVTLDTPDLSGRSHFWMFVGASGSQRVKAADVRRALGTRVLPSLLVRSLALAQADRRVTIEGGGLGHGVGLCQWGARGMALEGAAAREVIAYYYPGTGIGND
ncbi:MAG TPA: SpoIID/LytB domain-containing protein [Candidatus Baltobacteraceae bacterium]|nr:SpoIID/LytB domain-containing protein [Candidatus Baltobacteraceae bacterium]